MPSLKVDVEKAFKSRIVFQLTCPRCQACYVGQTDRHILRRFKEHLQPSQPFGQHVRLCGSMPNFEKREDVDVLQSTGRSIAFLQALEALWQREVKPIINTKDEYRSRVLTIKL